MYPYSRLPLPLLLTFVIAPACSSESIKDDPPCEVCDGIDNDGDGTVDEDFADTDGDGIADCVDAGTETCDGIDNDGDGEVDEGFDADGNGVADCLDELCNCADDDGDGEVDEGLDCAYDVSLEASADDVMDVYLDGAAVGSGSGWSNLFTQTYVLTGGTHALAVHARDTGGVIAGFNARVTVPGAGATDYDTGSGVWAVTNTDPTTAHGAAWTTGAAASTMSPDASFLASACASTWGSSPSGAPWVWAADCSREDLYRQNWFYVEVDVCPEASAEACDGVDNDNDGAVDEGYVDSDFDGIADCMEREECDGYDNDGDGAIDEDFADTDLDGVADCLDPEECDGLDNDGDGAVDEGFSDTDGDGKADCGDEETCDGLDNDGDGVIDEGFSDTDGDGRADCVDEETCDGLDNDGDGGIDENFRDTDADGTADCIDTEECDGLDNNGDASIDEGFSDTDGDGTADCVDTEECDGLDNDGDGTVDEAHPDFDGDGTADCVDVEDCDCADDNGDGLVDEGVDCTYDVDLDISADDYWQAWFDGASWGSGSSWSTLYTLSTSVPAGSHTIAVYAYDGFGRLAGMNARVTVPGAAADEWDTGQGEWLLSRQNPTLYGASSTWTTTPYAAMVSDAAYVASSTCTSSWGGRSAGPSGARWIWAESCSAPSTYPANWFLLELEVCPASASALP